MRKVAKRSEIGLEDDAVYAMYADGTMITDEETDSLLFPERRK